MIRHKFPYTNFHDLNLDWIVSQIVKLNKKIDDDLYKTIDNYIENHLGQFVMKAMYIEEENAITFKSEEVEQ